MSVCCDWCVLSNRILFVGPIPRPSEPYRPSVCVCVCVIKCALLQQGPSASTLSKKKEARLGRKKRKRCCKADIPKLCSAEHKLVLREASPSAPQRDWKEK